MGKRPSFQFYPGDWLRDSALRSCTPMARSLWIDILCYMTDTEPFGFLKVGNKVILPINLAPMVGLSIEDCQRYLQELREAGVFSEDESGCIFSRRMVRDEETRKKRAAGGILGGNPKLKQKTKVNLKGIHIDNHTSEDEDKEENEDVIEVGKGVQGENPFKMKLAQTLMDDFGFTELNDFDKLRWVHQFLNHIEVTKGLHYFQKKYQAYKKYKDLSGEIKHNFTGLIGTPAKQFENAGWDADNWQFKIDNFKPNGTTKPSNQPRGTIIPADTDYSTKL